MDFSILVPILERAGAPLIAQLLDTAAGAIGGPLAGMAVTGVTNFVLSKLGTAFGVAADPGTLAPAIEAAAQSDPSGTATKLQAVEDDHADLIQNALVQAHIDEANVENARATDLARQVGGAWYERAAPLVLAVIIVIGFFGMIALFATGHASTNDAIMVMLATTLAGAFGALVNYYYGSSIGSKTKTDMIAAGLPPKTAAPARRAGR
ncbi:MAG: hypothetical protein ACRYGP_16960 [Janthinobacterium lividum]